MIKQALPLAALYCVTVAIKWQPDEPLLNLRAVVLLPILVWISIVDLRQYRLPDLGTILIAGIGIAYLAMKAPDRLPLQLLRALIILAAFLLIGQWYFHRHGKEGLGMGDAKLFAAGALIAAPYQLADLIFIASVGGDNRLHVARALGHSPTIRTSLRTLHFIRDISNVVHRTIGRCLKPKRSDHIICLAPLSGSSELQERLS